MSLRIVFVSGTSSANRFRQEASFIYRCENLGLALAELGHQVEFRRLAELMVCNPAYDIAVFLRPSLSLHLRLALWRLRRAGCRVLADTDDLIFDRGMAAYRPAVLDGRVPVRKAVRKAARALGALTMFDGVTISTQELQQRFDALGTGVPSTVIPNAAHRTWRGLEFPSTDERRVTYFSGTATHDRDFAMVVPALCRLLDQHNDVRLFVVGRLETDLSHPRLVRIPKVEFSEYVPLVASSHVNIAPLEDTPFNRCKSALKAIEAGCFDVPTIASPIGDFLRLAPAGVLFADGTQGWFDQLSRAMDPGEHARLSRGLSERMRPLADIDLFARQFLDFAVN